MPPGFQREDLRARYDVRSIDEDEWHAHSGAVTKDLVEQTLRSRTTTAPGRLLNAGAGVYAFETPGWQEIAVDLFISPLSGRRSSVCASTERLPFLSETFSAVVCVGEVLAYCDPVKCLAEFSRLLVSGGILICDFGNSRGARFWSTDTYGRAADLVTGEYNGRPERTWVYDPSYIQMLLRSENLQIRRQVGTHTWSTLAKRLGVTQRFALEVERRLRWLTLPADWADVMTFVAERT